MGDTAAAVGAAMSSWRRAQTPLSLATVAVGTASAVVPVVGSAALWISGGVSRYRHVLGTIESERQGAVLLAGLVLGLVAVGLGASTYRSMPTKGAREAAIAGAVLGIQAVLFSAVYLWFRAGDTEVFVRNFLNFEDLAQYRGQFLLGVRNTVLLALLGEGLGIAVGLAMAMLVLSRRPVVRAPARAYINFFRGTPLLWQLSFGFFGIVLGLRLELTAYQIAVVIFALNAGAYTAEIFRAGIQSIERGQMEAARSLGMTYSQAMRYAILPQAIRRVIPPLTNEFVILIKDTSLVSILGLAESEREILKIGRDIYKDTFNATPFLIAAFAYLAVTLPMIRAVTWLERRLRSGLTGVVGQ